MERLDWAARAPVLEARDLPKFRDERVAPLERRPATDKDSMVVAGEEEAMGL